MLDTLLVALPVDVTEPVPEIVPEDDSVVDTDCDSDSEADVVGLELALGETDPLTEPVWLTLSEADAL